MYQFFYLRQSDKNPKMGTIYRAVYDDRTAVLRKSLKITIPGSLWDDKNQRVKECVDCDYQLFNHHLNDLELEFLQSNNNVQKFNKDCFLSFAEHLIATEYTNEETKKKYSTILNSLRTYIDEILKSKTLPIDELRKIDFIKKYAKWLEQRRYKKRIDEKVKKNKTIFNYISVIKTFVTRYNEIHPELDEIKTVHYLAQVGKIEKVESKMLFAHEINSIINYKPSDNAKRDKTIDAKYHFLFQFFTSGLRVSDLLLLNFKHFRNGRVEFVAKKNGEKISLPFGYKSCKVLSNLFPTEYEIAINENTLGNLTLSSDEIEALIMIKSKKELGLLTIEDIQKMIEYLKHDKTVDHLDRINILTTVARRIEQNVAVTFCSIMGSKPSGLVFNYLNFEDFKNLKVMDKRDLNKQQNYLFQKARCAYNRRLKRIAIDLGISNLSSHVSRHSFAYYMLDSGASIEEICHALGHSSIDITQKYIKQFPSKFSDKAIDRFSNRFQLS